MYLPAQQFTQSQVDVGTFPQESMISNPYILQPNMVQPWGLYRPAQQVVVRTSNQEGVVSNSYMLQPWGVYPQA